MSRWVAPAARWFVAGLVALSVDIPAAAAFLAAALAFENIPRRRAQLRSRSGCSAPGRVHHAPPAPKPVDVVGEAVFLGGPGMAEAVEILLEDGWVVRPPAPRSHVRVLGEHGAIVGVDPAPRRPALVGVMGADGRSFEVELHQAVELERAGLARRPGSPPPGRLAAFRRWLAALESPEVPAPARGPVGPRPPRRTG